MKDRIWWVLNSTHQIFPLSVPNARHAWKEYYAFRHFWVPKTPVPASMNALLFCWITTEIYGPHTAKWPLQDVVFQGHMMLCEKLEFFTYLFCTGLNFALFVNNCSLKSSHCWSKCSQGVCKATGRCSLSKQFASWKRYHFLYVCLWPPPEVIILPVLPARKESSKRPLI